MIVKTVNADGKCVLRDNVRTYVFEGGSVTMSFRGDRPPLTIEVAGPVYVITDAGVTMEKLSTQGEVEMSNLYIANCTHQRQQILYRVPEDNRPQPNNVVHQRWRAGKTHEPVAGSH